MKRGWYGERRRHSLARRGIKTSTKKQDAYVKASKYSAVKEISSLKPENIRVEKITADSVLVVSKKSGKTVVLKAGHDYDGDKVRNELDCHPLNPEEQGFFDNLKKGVQEAVDNYQARQSKKQDERIKDLREKLEKKEERLEKEKEEKLLRLESKVAEKRAAAEYKAKEREIDQLQAELDEGTFKQKAKLYYKSGIARAEAVARKAVKGRKKVGLTREELERTKPSTIKKLDAQQRRNAELEAKIRLRELKEKEQALKKELSASKKK